MTREDIKKIKGFTASIALKNDIIIKMDLDKKTIKYKVPYSKNNQSGEFNGDNAKEIIESISDIINDSLDVMITSLEECKIDKDWYDL